MANINKFDFKIKTLSPVHIGSGDKYDGSEYFLDVINEVNVFKRINIQKYYASLNDIEQEKFIKNLQKKNYQLKKIDSTKFTRYLAFNKVINRPNPTNEIIENIKTFDKAYIPGSSIKGAIENVIFYNALDKNDIPDLFNGKWINKRYINSFFSPSGKAHDNIMRFMQIKDSTSVKNPFIYEVSSVKPKKDGGHQQVIKTYLETIYSSKNLLSSSITTNYDKNAYKKLKIEDKSYMIDIDFIKESIYNFSSDYIDYELDFCKKHKLNNLARFYRNCKKQNSKNTPLLKIGHGSGFLATTVSLKIKQYGFDYFNLVKRNTKGKKSKSDFPITRKIITQDVTVNGKPAKMDKTIGWCQLLFE